MSTFTGRDLALLLPDKLDVRNAEGEADNFEPLKPKVDVTKRVTRYFPGKAPVWVGDDGMPYQFFAFLILSVVTYCFLQVIIEQNGTANSTLKKCLQFTLLLYHFSVTSPMLSSRPGHRQSNSYSHSLSIVYICSVYSSIWRSFR
jgi:hypothetical protein